MTMSISSPITGAPQTGLTTPTYTLTTDVAPDINGKQYAVTALGGTQTGVNIHSVACPFTLTASRPRVFKSLGKPNPTTGLVKEVPMNVYKLLSRKGVLPLAGQPYAIAMIRSEFSIPSGSDIADSINLLALLSAHFGALWANSSAFGDTVKSGIL